MSSTIWNVYVAILILYLMIVNKVDIEDNLDLTKFLKIMKRFV